MATVRSRKSMRDHAWVTIREVDIDIELQQCADEGKRLGPLAANGRALKRHLTAPGGQAAAREWMRKTIAVRSSGPHAGQEPSDLEGIRRLRPEALRVLNADYSRGRLYDRILGAWLGRCCGCYLGRPVEGARRADMAALLRHQGMRSLNRYLAASVPKSLLKSGKWWPAKVLSQAKLHFMPEDDDTNYTTIGLAVVQAAGGDFTPFDVATFWLNNVPYLHTCTAERVAYRNLAAGIDPPQSARVANPYREWIGAQIRADAFGYLAVGRPEQAAEYAWRDASISHVKNGIYGEMWVAAMLAAAYAHGDDPRAVIVAGLDEIPVSSRLAEAIRRVVRLHDRGVSASDALESIHSRWDESSPHHWCHTISNAKIVAYALLWGGLDFGRTVCLAVEACFDTDCNGATAGSVLGMMLGARRLPARWTGRLRNRLQTGVAGYHDVKISRIARDTAELAGKLLRQKNRKK